MSKSLRRVQSALTEAGVSTKVMEMAVETRTAQQAADAARCELDQIAKSIIFRGLNSDSAILFLTAGGNRVSEDKASMCAGEPLGKGDADLIRRQTGFAIGGVAPIGHLNPIRAFYDSTLMDFTTIWAAAGTPRHIFPIDPHILQKITDAQQADFIE